MTSEELAQSLKDENDYLDVKVLPDGSIAILMELLFTRAICLGVNRYGWTNRFCFADKALATQRFSELQSEDDEPQGYIARRPE